MAGLRRASLSAILFPLYTEGSVGSCKMNIRDAVEVWVAAALAFEVEFAT